MLLSGAQKAIPKKNPTLGLIFDILSYFMYYLIDYYIFSPIFSCLGLARVLEEVIN